MSNNQITKSDILAGGIILGFLGTIIYAIDVSSKLKTVASKLDKSVKELTSDVEIEIPTELVNRQVEKAVREEAKYQVERAMADARKDVVKKYATEIENVVEDEFKLQKADVAKTLKKKIDDIDIQEIKRQVKIEARDACVQKLKNDIDDLSDKYTEQIESMTSIYETVANKIQSIGD
ncbi:hypothetical protein [Butyrivibrio sp. INlla21]|uniref:hypothetical protein n=1 Tax=Butyrivibrio sp. INlla21 TaxID=1520811 RepID=UPI0008E71BC0|nr:hypothetical protein [Butyrivibrio sp. INlla21]SFU32751.1 hypothetical protein SAMN02910342_00090 [Butyrivibrio sp. INlla21]